MRELILVWFNMGTENPVLKNEFRSISNEEMASKMVKMAIFGYFDNFEGHFLITSGPKIIFLRLDPH